MITRQNRKICFSLLLVITTLFAGSFGAAAQAVPSPVFSLEKKGITVYLIRVKLTGYDACRACTGSYCRLKKTSTGTNGTKPTGVAAAPIMVPYGSTVLIPGLPVNEQRLVDDTGGGMRRYARRHNAIQFDVRFRTHAEARRFGTRKTEVFVVLNDPTEAQRAYFAQYAQYVWESDTSDESLALSEAQTRYQESQALAALTK